MHDDATESAIRRGGLLANLRLRRREHPLAMNASPDGFKVVDIQRPTKKRAAVQHWRRDPDPSWPHRVLS